MSNPGENAMQRAAAELPEGYSLQIELERGSGWITLHDAQGREIVFDEDTSETMTNRIHHAIELAITMAAQTKESS